ncbi:outer membrane assembly lipoprotein YfiO [Anaerohalosphaera lusitana]|uniref:Outer membrane assembly lipoprotein YfiO n=1 Tax=Anaerohalosphaera lusitana TaxID=1936003 RepID=A0A1U9NJV5_9BACT|nr:tetratricopeptide repeat protein [Anaerohalosphaera lusitana]AQT68014.1 outer membrane assembly lipoprotein YfiO [Anaerohalosphaera lusitana]
MARDKIARLTALFLYMAKKLKKRKANGGPAKSFMTVGPTLHYSHTNVHKRWALALTLFIIACAFWAVLFSGSPYPENIPALFNAETWSLGQHTTQPLSIFEYPWHIEVLALLLGIMIAVPLLISQLLSFRYSIPFILAVFFIAQMPLFAATLLISCIAVACRPLRFRSRFIALALCTAPQLIYLALLGGAEQLSPVEWGISYAPWFLAWLTALLITGAVILVGHYTRYRPGLTWTATAISLAAAFIIFQTTIGFAELDYRLYVAGNNPEEIRQFHDHKLTDNIDAALENPKTRALLSRGFYPTEPIQLRQELKKDIAVNLAYDRWPKWFDVTDNLNYQAKRQEILLQIDRFIRERPHCDRMPIALYYKAMLNECSPDIRTFQQTEILRFYNDYAHWENQPIWERLYEEFPQSPESLEARRRLASHLAAKGEFDRARQYCDTALALLKQAKPTIINNTSFLGVFSKPEKTAMTRFKLKDLKLHLKELQWLISPENLTEDPQSAQRLAEFVRLNPYKRDYPARLDELLAKITEEDPLHDNIMLAKTMIISDTQLRSKNLKELSVNYAGTDGGTRALYELGLLNIKIWKEQHEQTDFKVECLANARKYLRQFIETYPASIYRNEAEEKLDSLPTSSA